MLSKYRRLAIISDIHGEFARLERVVADVVAQGCDAIACLVGYAQYCVCDRLAETLEFRAAF